MISFKKNKSLTNHERDVCVCEYLAGKVKCQPISNDSHILIFFQFSCCCYILINISSDICWVCVQGQKMSFFCWFHSIAFFSLEDLFVAESVDLRRANKKMSCPYCNDDAVVIISTSNKKKKRIYISKNTHVYAQYTHIGITAKELIAIFFDV